MAEDTASSIDKKEPKFNSKHSSNNLIKRFIKEDTGTFYALYILDRHYEIDSEEVAEAYLITLLSVERFTETRELEKLYEALGMVNSNSIPYIENIERTRKRIKEAIKLAGYVNVTFD